jgi:hypothetical protein
MMWWLELMMAILAASWYVALPFYCQFWMNSVNSRLMALRRSCIGCFYSLSISMALNYKSMPLPGAMAISKQMAR